MFRFELVTVHKLVFRNYNHIRNDLFFAAYLFLSSFSKISDFQI